MGSRGIGRLIIISNPKFVLSRVLARSVIKIYLFSRARPNKNDKKWGFYGFQKTGKTLFRPFFKYFFLYIK
jgi:hypothetical protein